MVRWFLIFIAMTSIAYASEWQNIADGIQYKKAMIETKVPAEKSSAPGMIHAFQIDTLKYKLDIATAKEFGSPAMSAEQFSKKANTLIAVNGGFFTPEYSSLGLLVQSGKEINKIKQTSWWHIFQMRLFKPQIITKQEYNLMPDIEMAIEAGPKLLADGNIPKLKPGSAERSAIGISMDGKVIIAVTEDAPISLTEFAQYLRNIGCYDALNLDGGSSTQIYAKLGKFKLNRENLGFVANAVVVKPR